MLKLDYFVRKMQSLQVNNSIITWIRNAKFSDYYFLNEHEHVWGEFQVYCSFKRDKGKRLDVQLQI